MLGLSCFPSATILSNPHPRRRQTWVTHLQCQHLVLQQDFTTTHGSSGTIICMLELQTQSCRVSFHRSGALMVVPLSGPREVPELDLSWHGRQH